MNKSICLLLLLAPCLDPACLHAQGIHPKNSFCAQPIVSPSPYTQTKESSVLDLIGLEKALKGPPQDLSSMGIAGQSKRLRGGFVFSAGIGLLGYTTNWYYRALGYYSGYYYYYPVHVFSRLAFVAAIEQQSLFTLGPLDFDLRLDLDYGISGGTKEDWLPFGEQISSGGMTAGFTLSPRFCLPLELSNGVGCTPFISPGLHYQRLGSNGKDIGRQLGNMSDYYDGSEWNENIGGLVIGVGSMIETERMVITPELRFFVAGGGGTDWSPSRLRGEVSNEGPGGLLLLLTVGWRL